MIENKIDFCRSSGCGGSQRLDRAKPSFSFSFKKTTGGFTRGVRWMICKSSSSVTWINRGVFIGKARIVVHPGVYSSFSYDISCFVAFKLTQSFNFQECRKSSRKKEPTYCFVEYQITKWYHETLLCPQEVSFESSQLGFVSRLKNLELHAK